MAKTIKAIRDLTRDKRNANRGTKRGAQALENSITDLGAGRSILVDKAGNVIAGNKTLEAFRMAGKTEIVVVPTDGAKLVVVQRTDLDLEVDRKAKELAVADNRVGELSLNWDPDVLRELEKEIDLSTMFDPSELAALINTADDGANFLPGDAESQSQLDQTPIHKCPECGHEFKG